jgi:hypothetical protein
VELLVTVTIIGILGAIGVQSYEQVSRGVVENRVKLEAATMNAGVNSLVGGGAMPIVQYWMNEAANSGGNVSRAQAETMIRLLMGAGSGSAGGKDAQRVLTDGKILGTNTRIVWHNVGEGPRWRMAYVGGEFVPVGNNTEGFTLQRGGNEGNPLVPIDFDSNILEGQLSLRTEGNWIWDYQDASASGGGPPSSPSPPASGTNYPLTIEITPAGAGGVAPGSGFYPENTNIVLTRTENAGFFFQRWEGDASGIGSTTTILMNGPKTVRAVFAPVQPPTINVTGSGTIAAIGTLNMPATNPSSTMYEYRLRTSIDGGGTYGPWSPWITYSGGAFAVFPQASGLPTPPPPRYLANATPAPASTLGSPYTARWNTQWDVEPDPSSPTGTILSVVSDSFAPAETVVNAFVAENLKSGTWRSIFNANLATQIEARAIYNGYPIPASAIVTETTVVPRESEVAQYAWQLEILPPTIQALGNNPSTRLVEVINHPENPPAANLLARINNTELLPYTGPMSMFPQIEGYSLPSPVISPASGNHPNGTPYTVSLPPVTFPEGVNNVRLEVNGGSATAASGTINYAIANPFIVRARLLADVESIGRARAEFRGLQSDIVVTSPNFLEVIASATGFVSAEYTWTGGGGGGGGLDPDPTPPGPVGPLAPLGGIIDP